MTIQQGAPPDAVLPETVSRVLGRQAACVSEIMLGVRVTQAGPGWAEAEMIVPAGVSADAPLPSGLLGMLADVALGRTVLTTAPIGGGCRTATLRMDFTGAATTEGETLTARGELLARHGSLSLAAADIRAPTGQLAARTNGWFAVLDQDAAGRTDPGGNEPEAAGPSAFVPRANLAQLGELVRFTRRTAPDGIELSIQGCREMANNHGMMHGGMQAALTEGALLATAETSGRCDPRIVSLDMTMHRPVPANRVNLHASGHIVRAGRRVLTVATAFRSPTGSLLISATGTFGVSGGPSPALTQTGQQY
jgi:uncharacterized protein (TIGR00369 family)